MPDAQLSTDQPKLLSLIKTYPAPGLVVVQVHQLPAGKRRDRSGEEDKFYIGFPLIDQDRSKILGNGAIDPGKSFTFEFDFHHRIRGRIQGPFHFYLSKEN